MKSLLPDDLRDAWLAEASAATAMRIRRALRRQGVTWPADALRVRAAFIGSFTLDNIRDTFEVACLNEGLVPETFLGNYGQYAQELMDAASDLYAHRPELTFLAMDVRTVFRHCFGSSSTEAKPLQREADEFLDGLDELIARFGERGCGCLVLHTLDIPAYDPAGMHGARPGGITWAVRRFNEGLGQLADKYPHVRILDYDLVASRVGKLAACDEKMRLCGRFCVSSSAAAALVHAQLGLVKAVKGLGRKCIVVDLDNTLWGGIIGEDGLAGIRLGPTPPGNAYLEFQQLLEGYYQRGVILAVNSRNNPDDALRVLREHPDQVLRERHFGAIRINWQDKATNLVEIARELNIGLDSMVFLDDDRANRELVRAALPEVLVPELPEDPSLYCRTLLALNDFETLSLTGEDRLRGAMYAAERSRRAESAAAVDLDSFLAGLDIRVRIAPADEFSIPRIAQLTQRTNQFNMTTRRYTPAEIASLSACGEYRVVSAAAADKHGEMGIVGAAIVRCRPERWDIDTFLMSCRVLGRRIEDAFLWWLAQEAASAGATEIRGEVIFTAKNVPARGFYERLGMRLVEARTDGQIYIGAVGELASRPPAGVTIVDSALAEECAR